MDKKDDLDSLLKRFYKQVVQEIMPPKKRCPNEFLLGKYIHGELNEKDTESLEGHLLSCPECLESLEVIRTVEQAEETLLDVPPKLYEKARDIFQKELKMANLRKQRPEAKKITLIWDKIQEKIIQFRPDLERMIPAKGLEFQVVRKLTHLGKGFRTFPYKIIIDVDEGKISLEIYRSGKKGFLALKIFFHFIPPKVPVFIRATLYKADRIYSSVYLDQSGEAFFNQIKEGEYHLDFLEGEEILESIEFSILTLKNG